MGNPDIESVISSSIDKFLGKDVDFVVARIHEGKFKFQINYFVEFNIKRY